MSKITHFLHHVDFIGFMGGRMKEEKWNNKISLFIPEQLLEDNNFSNYALATYCVLQAMSVPAQQDRLCITYQQIVFYLIGGIPDRRNRIFDAIGSLSAAIPYFIRLLFTTCSIISLYFGTNSYGSNG